MAATRDKRSNAGNRMSKLLNDEEVEEFYETTYGGFKDLDNDNDYKSEDEIEDISDSDISIDEDDEVISENGEDDERPKRKQLVYKDPKAVKPSVAPKIKKPRTDEPKPQKSRTELSSLDESSTERKSIRRSTAVKSAETLRRMKERSVNKKKSSKQGKSYHMTQEQRLEEAKSTEIENLKSLRQFQELELEKKKVRCVKKTFQGPTIKFVSTTTPDISAVEKDETQISKNVETSTPDETKPEIVVTGRQSRTFITFSDHSTFRNAFPIRSKQILKPKRLCVITKMAAKYTDPATQLPFYNKNAFRTIREAYYHYLEEKGNKTDPQVVTWLEWNRNLRRYKKEESKSTARYLDTSVLSALRQLPNMSQIQLNTL